MNSLFFEDRPMKHSQRLTTPDSVSAILWDMDNVLCGRLLPGSNATLA
jgi:hypothetical protein